MSFNFNKLFLAAPLFAFVQAATAQNSNLVIFSEDAHKFYVILNGVQQNNVAQSNVKITNFEQNMAKVKIVFENNSLNTISKTIYFNEPNYEWLYNIRTKKGKLVMNGMSYRAISTQTEPNQYVHVYGQPVPPATTTTTTVQTVETTTTTNQNPSGNVTTNTNQNPNGNVTISTNVSGNQNPNGNVTTTTNTNQNPNGSANVSINVSENTNQNPNGNANVSINVSENNGKNPTTTTNTTNTNLDNSNVSLNMGINDGMGGGNISINISVTDSNGNGIPDDQEGFNQNPNGNANVSINVNENVNQNPNGNVNVNVSGNGLPNNSTTTTTTTTTTTSTSAPNTTTTATTNNNPAANCFATMSSTDYEKLKAAVKAKAFDSDQLIVAKQGCKNGCMSAEQITGVMKVMKFDSARLEFAKYAYPFCVDKNNYYQVNDAFTHSSSTEELEEALNLGK